MRLKAKTSIVVSLLVIITMGLLFQNCGKVPNYPVGQPLPQEPDDDNQGSGGQDPPTYSPDPAATAISVPGLIKSFTLNGVDMQSFDGKVGESLVIRFQPDWDKFGGLANSPSGYFAVLVWDVKNGASALSLKSGAWPYPVELFETTVNEQPVVGELASFSLDTVKIPADGARVALNLAPPRGEHVVRVIFADSLLDFTGADFSVMGLDEVTQLVISNSLLHASGDLHYEAVDFSFVL